MKMLRYVNVGIKVKVCTNKALFVQHALIVLHNITISKLWIRYLHMMKTVDFHSQYITV